MIVWGKLNSQSGKKGGSVRILFFGKCLSIDSIKPETISWKEWYLPTMSEFSLREWAILIYLVLLHMFSGKTFTS